LNLIVVLLLILAGPTEPVHQHRATFVRVVDGDTYQLDVDLDFHVHVVESFRLFGWDCPERNTDAGTVATEKARVLLAAAKVIIIESKGVQSFARWVARIWIDGIDLGEALAPICVPMKAPR